MSAARSLEGRGTRESEWSAWNLPGHVPAADLEALVPRDAAVAIVAPHPDDEVLGAAAILAQTSLRASPVRIVGVTDGEASHPGSRRYLPDDLRHLRDLERKRGLAALGARAEVQRLAFADGGVAEEEKKLVEVLSEIALDVDLLVATWALDGHPDHEAVGRASVAAARAADVPILFVPIWTWHWATPGEPEVPWDRAVRVDLSPAVAEAKRRALAMHATQLEPDPTTGRDAVLPPWATVRLLRDFEVYFR